MHASGAVGLGGDLIIDLNGFNGQLDDLVGHSLVLLEADMGMSGDFDSIHWTRFSPSLLNVSCSVDQNTVTAHFTEVPEPGTFPLLLAGIGGLRAVQTAKRRQAKIIRCPYRKRHPGA